MTESRTSNPSFALTILAGDIARARLRESGWHPELFGTLVGASGGAKLLGLGHLDRFVFGDYLQRSSHPMDLYGSSIGSWRHAALASHDPLAAISNLQHRYLNQAWAEDDARSRTQIVDALCEWVLDGILGPEAMVAITQHPRFTTHIVTARGVGLNSHTSKVAVALGMAAAASLNTVHRSLLQRSFQRAVFSTGPGAGFEFRDFNTVHVPLHTGNLRQALVASGSIPFLMSGVRNVIDAPPGHYWDGGIIDYHFDFANVNRERLVLYPHFMSGAVKGWFDKSLPWRRNKANLMRNVVMLAPSRHYLALLPFGKIPDRKDFSRMPQSTRLAYWTEVVNRSEVLAASFQQVIEDSDPLRYIEPFN